MPNKFSFSNIDASKATPLEGSGDSAVRNNAVFASFELGWRNMLFLTLTGRNDWNSRLVNTSSAAWLLLSSVGLSAVISEMCNMPDWFPYLKIRFLYPGRSAGITFRPGTVTIPIKGGMIEENGIFPFTDFKPERQTLGK